MKRMGNSITFVRNKARKVSKIDWAHHLPIKSFFMVGRIYMGFRDQLTTDFLYAEGFTPKYSLNDRAK